jgi:hypothetical protein
MNQVDPPQHWYASAAEIYRAFTEIGQVWVTIGASTSRADIADHGEWAPSVASVQTVL